MSNSDCLVDEKATFLSVLEQEIRWISDEDELNLNSESIKSFAETIIDSEDFHQKLHFIVQDALEFWMKQKKID